MWKKLEGLLIQRPRKASSASATASSSLVNLPTRMHDYDHRFGDMSAKTKAGCRTSELNAEGY